MGFYRFLNEHYLNKNAFLTRMLSMTLCVRATEVLLHVWSNEFYDTTLSTDSNMTLAFSHLTIESGVV